MLLGQRAARSLQSLRFNPEIDQGIGENGLEDDAGTGKGHLLQHLQQNQAGLPEKMRVRRKVGAEIIPNGLGALYPEDRRGVELRERGVLVHGNSLKLMMMNRII